MSQGYTGPPQSSGGGGGMVVVVVLIIGAVLGLGCLGVCGLVLFGFAWTDQPVAMNRQGPLPSNSTVSIEESLGQAVLVATASDMISNDARVKEALGDPITVEQGGEQPGSAADGETSFDLPLRGPKGTATGHVSGQRAATGWEVTAVKVTLADGSTIDINHIATTPGQETPAEPFTLPELPAGSGDINGIDSNNPSDTSDM